MFIETTIQIRRLLNRRMKQLINEKMKDKDCVTSSYVWMEFKRTILQDIECLFHIIDSKAVDQVNIYDTDILEWIMETSVRFSKRTLERILMLYVAVRRNLSTFEFEKSEILSYLKIICSHLKKEFFVSPNSMHLKRKFTYVDKTGCRLASSHVRPGNLIERRMSCGGSTARCKLVRFCEDEKKTLKEMLQRLFLAVRNPRVKSDDKKVYQKIIDVFEQSKDNRDEYNFERI